MVKTQEDTIKYLRAYSALKKVPQQDIVAEGINRILADEDPAFIELLKMYVSHEEHTKHLKLKSSGRPAKK